MLGNPAISGLTLQIHWDVVNPNPPTGANPYVWTYIDDAFAQISDLECSNPTQAAKTVQFIVTPGFNSPQWVLNELYLLRRVVPDAGADAEHVREGDILGLPGTCRRQRASAAVEFHLIRAPGEPS